MRRERKVRNAGEHLSLGDTTYILDEVEGSGGSAIVYKARYEDHLNRGVYHSVFIKELFPFHPKGMIYRGEDGSIVCEEDGIETMLHCKQGFYEGNRANLELLKLLPEKISGNINSYEAYGTYYSVLTVHGGKSLAQIVEEKKQYNLQEATEVLNRVLKALKCFHDNGMLHMDISPDNILMMTEQAILIDYNSIWPMERTPGNILYYSTKEGYTAPEVLLRQEKSIGPAADLFSVCAVFFRLLFGRILTQEDLSGKNLTRCFGKNAECFRKQPVTAVKKAAQILMKGLHLLPGKRYQSVSELQMDFWELQKRIEGKGITASAIFESSKKRYNEFRKMEETYLERRIEKADGTIYNEEECLDILGDGTCLLIQGPGGMGKTQFLRKLWESGTKKYTETIAIPIYLQLNEYQQAEGENYYIRKMILKHLKFDEECGNLDEAVLKLDELWNGTKEIYRYILLLDGLNEAGTKRQKLIREIEELGRMEKIGILITDRSDAIQKYGLKDFMSAKLLPLEREVVKEELRQKGIETPSSESVMQLLTNPMLLSLYQSAYTVEKESREEKIAGVPDAESLVLLYLKSLSLRQLRRYSGNPREQLRCNYLLEHLLPEIAGELKQKKRTLFKLEELYQLLQKDYQRMKSRDFSIVFPDYMGKTRFILEGIANEREWFDYAVEEQLTDHLGLLEKTEQGSYGLVHDNFLESLCRQSQENHRKLTVYQRRKWSKKSAITILAAMILFGGSTAAWKKWGVTVKHLSKEDKTILHEAVDRLAINLKVWNDQIAAQKSIVEKALTQAVLDGESSGISDLTELIAREEKSLANKYYKVDIGIEHLQKIEEKNLPISGDIIEILYQKPYDMQVMLENHLSHIKKVICNPDSVYTSAEKRKPLLESYQNYLNYQAELCYLQYLQILGEVDAESVEEMKDIAETLGVFHEYMQKYSFTVLSAEELADQIRITEENIKTAKEVMLEQNFKF